ncbi:hypothetical protein ACQ9BO_19705 [Flavobacterium sp. P21]|uniref:hypothetical protein n=1 Tax=Flavobacterium sp. P21 TaxID=3423948 RepID=UPI003D665494
MKKLICFMIVFFSCFLAKAQTTAEIPAETLPAVQNNSLKSDEGQNYDPEDLPWHARRFKFTAGAFFPVNNTQVEVGSNNGNFGNMIDFEKDLGFKKTPNHLSLLLSGEFQEDQD